jgi:hypothetical protein
MQVPSRKGGYLQPQHFKLIPRHTRMGSALARAADVLLLMFFFLFLSLSICSNLTAAGYH